MEANQDVGGFSMVFVGRDMTFQDRESAENVAESIISLVFVDVWTLLSDEGQVQLIDESAARMLKRFRQLVKKEKLDPKAASIQSCREEYVRSLELVAEKTAGTTDFYG